MKYRKFGQLDWEASVLGFGCMRLPTIDGVPGQIDQDKTTEMVYAALEAGVNYFDTAFPYHDQKSEASLSKALQGGYREKVKIATKSPVWLINESSDYKKFLDIQLKRLDTEVIDFYMFHAINRRTWERVKKFNLIEKAEAAKADGRIRNIGFSFHDAFDIFKDIVDYYADWDFCQIQYNYMDMNFQAGTKGLRYAKEKGLPVIIMEPLRGGKLAVDIPVAEQVWQSEAKKRTPADWALQWIWNQPEVTVVLSGMSTLEQVQENCESASQSGVGTMTETELAYIDQLRKAIKARSPIPCTQCEYCLPCPSGVNIPFVFEFYNKIAMFDDIRASRFFFHTFLQPEEKANQCTQCYECISKCPQNIPITKLMPIMEDVLEKEQPYQKLDAFGFGRE